MKIRFGALLMAGLWICGPALAANTATGRTPPAPFTPSAEPSMELIPEKNCQAEIAQQSAAFEKSQGRAPTERHLSLWRSTCEEEAARDAKLNADIRAKHGERVAEWRAQEQERRAANAQAQAVFQAEEEAAFLVAMVIQKRLSSIGEWGDAKLLRDNAHLLTGKLVAIEANLVERIDAQNIVFRIPGWNNVWVRGVPADEAVMAGVPYVLVGRVAGLETVANDQGKVRYKGPVMEWVDLRPCRLELPNGLKPLSAQCLPLLALNRLIAR